MASSSPQREHHPVWQPRKLGGWWKCRHGTHRVQHTQLHHTSPTPHVLMVPFEPPGAAPFAPETQRSYGSSASMQDEATNKWAFTDLLHCPVATYYPAAVSWIVSHPSRATCARSQRQVISWGGKRRVRLHEVECEGVCDHCIAICNRIWQVD